MSLPGEMNTRKDGEKEWAELIKIQVRLNASYGGFNFSNLIMATLRTTSMAGIARTAPSGQ